MNPVLDPQLAEALTPDERRQILVKLRTEAVRLKTHAERLSFAVRTIESMCCHDFGGETIVGPYTFKTCRHCGAETSSL